MDIYSLKVKCSLAFRFACYLCTDGHMTESEVIFYYFSFVKLFQIIIIIIISESFSFKMLTQQLQKPVT
jgi:hypothetical protein